MIRGFFKYSAILLTVTMLVNHSHANSERAPKSGQIQATHQSWSSWGGEITLQLNQAILRDLDIRIFNGAQEPYEESEITLEFDHHSSLSFWTLNGGFDGVRHGRLKTRTGFNLQIGDLVRSINYLQVIPGATRKTEFTLSDDQGKPLFTLNNTHYLLDRENDRVSFRHMDMRLSQVTAERLGVIAYSDLAVGSAEFMTQVNRPPDSEYLKLGACGSPNWDDGVNFLTDVALINIPKVDQQQLIGTRVFISPDAELQNVGTADVPWHRKFRTPVGAGYPPPYNADQHPYLVWSLYRLLDDKIEQLGTSGLKHAFGTVNDVCDCPSGSVLWSPLNSPNGMGCTDLYGSATNNSPAHMGIREELDPNTGIWEQCGSIFAPNESPPGPCPQGRASIPFDEIPRRLEVEESDLTVPGARYFLEAWYVIRDDVNIFNSMGFLEVFPDKPAQIWIFPDNDDYSIGSMIEHWQTSLLTSPQTLATPIDSSNGHARLVSHVNNLGDGVYEYVYSVMNHDYTVGFNRLSFLLPLAPDADAHVDPDYDMANNWSASHNAGTFSWDAQSADDRIRWGTLHRFSIESTGSPEQTTATLTDVNGTTITVSVFVPGVPALFEDGFEDQNSR